MNYPHRNDQTTAQKLFDRYRPLAFWFANRYRQSAGAQRIPFEDVEQQALLALWSAALRYDPTKGFQFTTLAGLMIRQAFCGLFRDRAQHRREVSVDPQITAELDAGRAAHQVEPDVAGQLDAALAHLDARTRSIIKARFGLGQLPLARRTRAYDDCNLTLEALGQRYGVSRERVRQIIHQGLRKLQRQFRGKSVLD